MLLGTSKIAIASALAATVVACHHEPGNDATGAPPRNIVVPTPSASPDDEPPDAEALPPRESTPPSFVTESGVRIQEIRVGSGATAEPGNRVRLHYVGTLEDGSVFDSSRTRNQPFVAELGRGQLIPGFEQGIAGMRVGGIRRVTIPPELAYGERGAGAKVPPNATLIFEIELLDVQ